MLTKSEPSVVTAKQKIDSYFTTFDAAKIISLAAEKMKNKANAGILRGGSRQSGNDAGAQGWLWFMDTCNDKRDMINFGLSQIRKYLISRRFDCAIDFYQT